MFLSPFPVPPTHVNPPIAPRMRFANFPPWQIILHRLGTDKLANPDLDLGMSNDLELADSPKKECLDQSAKRPKKGGNECSTYAKDFPHLKNPED